ncbi:PDDEXK nuclease domain-containing protein [Fusobacterium polymorphum]
MNIAIFSIPYNFDFISIREGYNEKELKDALMDNIQKFLLELGTGFAFVGREYRLVVGKTEEFIDMLFYHIKLHCYIVIEVKISAFKPADIGQLGTYITSVNHI